MIKDIIAFRVCRSFRMLPTCNNVNVRIALCGHSTAFPGPTTRHRMEGQSSGVAMFTSRSSARTNGGRKVQ
jgi:hypothetical protein